MDIVSWLFMWFFVLLMLGVWLLVIAAIAHAGQGLHVSGRHYVPVGTRPRASQLSRAFGVQLAVAVLALVMLSRSNFFFFTEGAVWTLILIIVLAVLLALYLYNARAVNRLDDVRIAAHHTNTHAYQRVV
jgi:hypothetical protein